ncbi:UvrD-helicase domain-containing protein [Actinoallomurus bryophytorum]|uniref:UvrD-helicase domain-containing protein n=1 Tax=Actinoallomurus bryophytorum TaxID=1490222 RepID=UPI001FE68B56|nr:UvrD-helicase domain-containing protein [Actinoallomurus bryophytorum]
MTFYADLHIHSKYSRACSKDCDLEHLAWWAGRKGVSVVGTGDFTHPAWMDELRENLVPAEPGLFRLRPELERRVSRTLPPACRQPVRFLLSVEISTIYKKGERTRKVHHLLYAPSFEAAERITAALAKIGNLASDGRPILGLDSRHLLEITLQSDPGSYLIPAHVWTPWFSVLGSKSGFDAVADCYDDLAGHIFAVETGLSSDPLMNWRVPSLDGYRLVSNSDAHSPPALAREASMFSTEMDYYALRAALETGQGYGGSVEFFPEEGKYHLDGHRKCGVRLDPAETKAHGGRCPSCGRPLTVGVLSRVDELAAHPEGRRPEGAANFRNLIPLPEIVSEIRGVGPRSKSVLGHIAELVSSLGPELSILDDVPLDDVRDAGGELLAEALGRLRRGTVIRDAGYDGEYGEIRLFEPGELRREGKRAVGLTGAPDDAGLFDLPGATTRTGARAAGASEGAYGAVEGHAAVTAPVTERDSGGSEAAGYAEPPIEGQQDILEAAEAVEALAAAGADVAGNVGGTPGTGANGAGAEASGTASAGTESAGTRGSRRGNAGNGSHSAGSDHAGTGSAQDGRSAGDGVVSVPGNAGPDGVRSADAGAGGLETGDLGTENRGTENRGTGGPGGAGAGSVLGGLDPDQRAAAAHPGGPLLIIAGPGTGKTRTLTHRIAHLVAERDVEPEHCLAITFTRRAAEEMRERLQALLPGKADRLTVATFHSLGALILREQYELAGLPADFRIADETERLEIAREMTGSDKEAKKLLADFDRPNRPRRGPGLPSTTPKAGENGGAYPAGRSGENDSDGSNGPAGSHGSAGPAGFSDPSELSDPTGSTVSATPAGSANAGDAAVGQYDLEARGSFEKRLRERGLADFTDLLRLPVQLLAQDAALTAHYRERWPWISVDEYQDVDETQYALLRLLADTDGNLTAIGDPDQAIYAFRGADVGFFLRFEDDFSAATTVLLTRNYRSAPAIVRGAAGAIKATSLVPDRVLDPQRSGERLIRVHESVDAQAEAEFVTSTIDRLLGGSSFHSLDSGRADGHHDEHLDFSDIAVLYRSSAQAEPVMDALTRAGMPYQKRSHDRLMKRPGVREVAAELRHHGGPLTVRLKAAVGSLTEIHDETVLRTAAELLTPLAVQCDEDLEAFLGELALGAEVDAFDPRADRIALLTMHASKGLEFPVVFIVGCEDGLLPLRLPDTDEAEERRLFFVGMTRAQSSLYLSGSKRREPSPFLRTIPGKYVTRSEPTTRRRPRDHQLRLL